MNTIVRLVGVFALVMTIGCGSSDPPVPTGPSAVPTSTPAPTPSPAPTPVPAPTPLLPNLTGVWVDRDPSIGYTVTLTLVQSATGVTGGWVNTHQRINLQSSGIGPLSGSVTEDAFTFAANIVVVSSSSTGEGCPARVWGTLRATAAGEAIAGLVWSLSQCRGRPGGSVRTFRKE